MQKPMRLRKVNEYLEYEDFNFVSYNFEPSSKGKPSLYKCHIFLLCFNDGLRFVSEDHTIPVKKNSLLIISPNNSGFLENSTKSVLKSMYLVISEKLFQDAINYFGRFDILQSVFSADYPQTVSLSNYQCQLFRQEFSESSKYRLNDTLQTVYVKYFLQFILTKFLLPHCYCKQAVNNSPNADIPLWLASTLETVSFSVDNFSKSVDFMAKTANCSPTHLERTMKKYLNTTPLEFLTDLRLKYIARTLLISEQSIDSIFYEAGYTNTGWGRNLFKNRYGVTPSKYRKNNALDNKQSNDSVIF